MKQLIEEINDCVLRHLALNGILVLDGVMKGQFQKNCVNSQIPDVQKQCITLKTQLSFFKGAQVVHILEDIVWYVRFHWTNFCEITKSL